VPDQHHDEDSERPIFLSARVGRRVGCVNPITLLRWYSSISPPRRSCRRIVDASGVIESDPVEGVGPCELERRGAAGAR
jgi:hypothetical protein